MVKRKLKNESVRCTTAKPWNSAYENFSERMSRIGQIPANRFCRFGLSLEIEVAMVHAHIAHRRNRDGSFDSICKTCFATVARSIDEAGLAGPERNHARDPSVVIEREVLLSRPPRIGISLVPRPPGVALPAESAMGTGTSRWMQKPDI